MAPGLTLRPPPPPNEHGAWAMLAIPLVLGLAAARPPDGAALLIVPAMVFLFLSRYAALPAAVRLVEGKPAAPGFMARRLFWSAVYLGASLACLAGALLCAGPAAFAGTLRAGAVTTSLGAAQTALALAGRGRTIGAEVLGMAGLASGATLVTSAAGRPLEARSLGVAIVALTYFLSSLSLVRDHRARSRGRARPGLACAWTHAVLGALLVLESAGGLIRAAALLAFVPVFARAAWELRFPARTIRELGWREVAVAGLFTLIASAAYLA